MAKCIMVQGTMSGVGKSILVTGLCRLFAREGYRVAPFKSQNMALNSFVTPDGLELGRAQAVQAEAAWKACDVRMNPILLKPSSETGSQLIVMGEVRGTYDARDYFRMKKSLLPEILDAYHSLAAENDILVIEGAGSPAEINLREDDIVNMGLAELVHAPVLLVGDIDRGGVFAQLYGTVSLLRPNERDLLAGMLINKFRGDPALLLPGLRQIEALTGLPVLGLIPWLPLDIDDEDSLAPRLTDSPGKKLLDVAVVRLPRISNFTDFAPLGSHPAVGVRYVASPAKLGKPDLLILPGTKNTMADLDWLRESGFAEQIYHSHAEGVPILGVCGGFQLLGRRISDPEGVEKRGSREGLGLLPCETVFCGGKTRQRRVAVCTAAPFAGARLEGYEIHMGVTEGDGASFCRLDDGREDGCVQGTVFGTYLHGLFDSGELTIRLAEWLAAKKGLCIAPQEPENRAVWRNRQYDLLADTLQKTLDRQAIDRAMEAFSDEKQTG